MRVGKFVVLAAALTSLALVATACATESKVDTENKNGDSNVSDVLSFDVFNPGEKSIFSVTSTIVTAGDEALLVDAQFQANDARTVVEKIRNSGKKLTQIFISHSDPDYYFGLDTIADAFPEAKILASPATVQLIERTKDAKLEVWGDQLKENKPKRIIVPTALEGNTLTVGGETIEVRGLDSIDPGHTYLWAPSAKTVLGGVSIDGNEHPWVADSQTAASRKIWIDKLGEIQGLGAARVIPGHFVSQGSDAKDLSPQSIEFTREYLTAFSKEAATAKNSDEFISAIDSKYPGLPAKSSLETSAKVILGEIPWTTESYFPAVGKTVTVNFGKVSYELDFTSGESLTFRGVSADTQGQSETVTYTAIPVAPGVYMVYWSEPQSGARVVHVEDFNHGQVWTNIAGKDGSFTNLEGTLSIKGSIK